MPGDIRNDIAKLIVTGAGLEPTRRLRAALRYAIPGARVRTTGFKGIFVLEAEGNPYELIQILHRECRESIGHVTAVLAEVESRLESIQEAAVRIGREEIGPEESFCFRIHKRGAHSLKKGTMILEREIGGAIWTALEKKYAATPTVRLKNPDVAVVAEVLGTITTVGISRRNWREMVHTA